MKLLLQLLRASLRVALILVFFFVVGEELLRVQHYGLAGLSYSEMQAQDARGMGVEPPVQDPELRAWMDRHTPGWRLIWGFMPGSQGFMRGAAVSVNNLGFRGPDRTVAKDPNTFRIAVLGNSITFGSGVDVEESWPSVLESLLNARAEARASGSQGAGADVRHIEVFNLATTQTWECFNRHVQRALYFEPDLILWSVSRTAHPAVCEKNLRAAAKIAQERSVPFFAFSIGTKNYKTTSARIPHMELLPPLQVVWEPEDYIYPGDQHPVASIHREIATVLAERLGAREELLADLAARFTPDYTTSWTPPEPIPSRGEMKMMQNIRQTGFWSSRLVHRIEDRWRKTKLGLARDFAWLSSSS